MLKFIFLASVKQGLWIPCGECLYCGKWEKNQLGGDLDLNQTMPLSNSSKIF